MSCSPFQRSSSMSTCWLWLSICWTTAIVQGFVVQPSTSRGLGARRVTLEAYRDFAATSSSSSHFNIEDLMRIEDEGRQVLMGDVPLFPLSVDQAAHAHGMPWTSSIVEGSGVDESASPLLFMHFWQWQMDFLQSAVTNLRVAPMSEKHAYRENGEKKARVVSQSFESDEYRKIRMTYYDAGDGAQIYTSVFYPRPEYNLPLLGLDLLAFGGRKFVAVIDFHPITQEQKDNADYEGRLKAIRDLYPSMHQTMSAKYYDESKYFSKQTLFGRFESKEDVLNVLPAFSQYMQEHVDLARQTEPSMSNAAQVWEGQQEYDTYLARRDPGIALFNSMFGEEWTASFIYDFLFSLSQRPTAEEEAQLKAERAAAAQAQRQQQQQQSQDTEETRRR